MVGPLNLPLISNKFPGDADPASLETTLENNSSRSQCKMLGSDEGAAVY